MIVTVFLFFHFHLYVDIVLSLATSIQFSTYLYLYLYFFRLSFLLQHDVIFHFIHLPSSIHFLLLASRLYYILYRFYIMMFLICFIYFIFLVFFLFSVSLVFYRLQLDYVNFRFSIEFYRFIAFCLPCTKKRRRLLLLVLHQYLYIGFAPSRVDVAILISTMPKNCGTHMCVFCSKSSRDYTSLGVVIFAHCISDGSVLFLAIASINSVRLPMHRADNNMYVQQCV
jgi:hypothetical protein